MKKAKNFCILLLFTLCAATAAAATDWQALMRQSTDAAVQAAMTQTPDGLSLSAEELALYRLGFAQGYDAGQAAEAPASGIAASDEPMVWIPIHGGKKYHADASCSQMKSPMEVPLSVALEKGYTPCKLCYPTR